MPLPPPPMDGWLVTEVYAVGYDARGRSIGSQQLPYVGVTAVNEALWPLADPKNLFSSETD